METGIIYRAIGPSGKSYIGQTTYGLKRRQATHITKAQRQENENNHFSNAIKKYGFGNFRWEVIFEDIPTKDLDWYEMWTIQLFDSYKNGYNSTIGGDGNRGFKHSEETKRRMSEKAKQRGIFPGLTGPVTEESRMKISLSLQGKRKTEGHRNRIQQSLCKNLWKITKPDGLTEYTLNLNRYCGENGLNNGHMVQVAKGKENHHKGYCCEKLSEIDYDSNYAKL